MKRPGKQMYGSTAVAHAVWKHQHPDSCHDKKFIVYRSTGGGHGIGSVLHMTTVILQAALNLNRILVLYPQPGGEWVNGSYCDGFDTWDSCYFEPISSCTIADALGHRTVSEATWEKIPWLDAKNYKTNKDRVLKEYLDHCGSCYITRETNPDMFHDLLRAGNIPLSFYYWWRAQGTAYVVRPNERTLRELERRRTLIFNGEDIKEGTISVHVRHGDKWIESQLASDETFFKNAEKLLDNNQGLKRRIFLSTEDAETVKYFSKLQWWNVRWTDVKRIHDNSTGPAKFASQIGWTEEFLNSLLSLQLALECDGWVGMITSNWNRLIDELRSTIRCKYDHPYLDVFQGTNITDYVW